jgi:hypothetical protein
MYSLFLPSATEQEPKYATLRDLWTREGALGRAADRYATLTGDFVFALQAMLEDQLGHPIPGLWISVPIGVPDPANIQEQLAEALGSQRLELANARRDRRPFTALAGLHQAALNRVLWVAQSDEATLKELLIAEACCADLLLVARVWVEQQAMAEAKLLHGPDRVVDAGLVRSLRYASEAALLEFDPQIQSGIPLQIIFAPEILVESLGGQGHAGRSHGKGEIPGPQGA